MTVRDLVQILNRCEPDALVYTSDDADHWHRAVLPVLVYQTTAGKVFPDLDAPDRDRPAIVLAP